LDGSSPQICGFGFLCLFEILESHTHEQKTSQNNRLAYRVFILNGGFSRQLVHAE
jgi:hypothetical protein